MGQSHSNLIHCPSACPCARSSQKGIEDNARSLKDQIEELHWGSHGSPVLLLGHSKGGLDAAAAVTIYRDQLAGKVAGVVFAQSPYGGTPLASDAVRVGQVWDSASRAVIGGILSRFFSVSR